MCITLRLPNEVIAEIVQNALKSDQTTLCRVSKIFHALVLPILDRTVVLDLFRQGALEAFCSAIVRNPQRADSVRSLTFLHGYSLSDPGPLKDLLMECLNLTRRLEHLSIKDLRPTGVGSCLSSLTFPALMSCFLDTRVAWQPSVAEFLSRHPTITHLRLWSVIAPDSPHIPEGTLLPELQYYHGALSLLCPFLAHSLVAVQTSWSAETIGLGRLALTVQTNPDLTLCFDCVSPTPVSELLLHVSTHMPRLKNLKLRTWIGGITAETVNHITAHLPRFESLEYLAFEDAIARPGLTLDVDSSREALRIWVDICPTLRGCCIDQIGWRKDPEKWEECSKSVFDTESGFCERSLNALDVAESDIAAKSDWKQHKPICKVFGSLTTDVRAPQALVLPLPEEPIRDLEVLHNATKSQASRMIRLCEDQLLRCGDAWTSKDKLIVHTKELMKGTVFEEILHRLPQVKTLEVRIVIRAFTIGFCADFVLRPRVANLPVERTPSSIQMETCPCFHHRYFPQKTNPATLRIETAPHKGENACTFRLRKY
ncbi:hypothetical protein FB45DRAFT_1096004 [Roridomyces roridus]|uniref:F-box domain-containing protein n=1 Tax=Roridomyces roridus TaxID=1738132 RepID=A0AAD7BG45_9AGAR|nr:hypothetical protein FB45DRAFT_1096004 [Roridomyces roridus]